jgi:hypothetical protein
MYPINGITTDPLQTMTIILPNNNQMSMTINFVSMQFGWFITNLTYTPQNFVLNGLRITNNPNMLYPWKNILQFGLACFSQQDIEPGQSYSFSSGASTLYILDSSEVEELTTLYDNGTA